MYETFHLLDGIDGCFLGIGRRNARQGRKKKRTHEDTFRKTSSVPFIRVKGVERAFLEKAVT